MKIGIIDAEIINKKKHRFPNLCSMKISAYHKSKGDEVTLLRDYDSLNEYDKVYISKVFIKTNLPHEEKDADKTEENCCEYYANDPILSLDNVVGGGTGFYYDKAKPLDDEIEHMMPDYHLYDEWISDMVEGGAKQSEFRYYTDYSIGFLTRGCFRQCEFCVNRHYKSCKPHSSFYEFYDHSRKKACFLDDNFFACSNWRDLIQPVKDSNKPFQFKQGLDERLLTEEKVKEIFTWRYDGEFIFAFDNIEDKDRIVNKLNLIYSLYPDTHIRTKFYVFCGYDRANEYSDEFWLQDIIDTLERLSILSKYSANGYIMRHENYKNSPYSGIYTTLAQWANQPSIYWNMTLREFCYRHSMGKWQTKYRTNYEGFLDDGHKKGAGWRRLDQFEKEHPEIAKKYFDVHNRQSAQYGCRYNILKEKEQNSYD